MKTLLPFTPWDREARVTGADNTDAEVGHALMQLLNATGRWLQRGHDDVRERVDLIEQFFEAGIA